MTQPTADHPHTDPGDGRTECERCGKYVWPVIHSCKGVPVTARAKARREVPDAETRTQYGVRLHWDDGRTEDQPCDNLAFAQHRVDFHARQRADQPGWKARAELIERTITVSPWTAPEVKP